MRALGDAARRAQCFLRISRGSRSRPDACAAPLAMDGGSVWGALKARWERSMDLAVYKTLVPLALQAPRRTGVG